jgi:adenine-specific DNA glycosylase
VQQPQYCADGKLAWQLATALVAAGGGASAGELNQAVMELGATLCAPDGSGLDASDPLRAHYRSTAIGRDAHRAMADGELEEMLYNGGEELGIFSCEVCRHSAQAFLDGLRAAAGGGGGTSKGKPKKPAAAAAGGGGRNPEEAAAALVHSMLPLPKPAKSRREERMVVLALRRSEEGAAARWLLQVCSPPRHHHGTSPCNLTM